MAMDAMITNTPPPLPSRTPFPPASFLLSYPAGKNGSFLTGRLAMLRRRCVWIRVRVILPQMVFSRCLRPVGLSLTNAICFFCEVGGGEGKGIVLRFQACAGIIFRQRNTQGTVIAQTRRECII